MRSAAKPSTKVTLRVTAASNDPRDVSAATITTSGVIELIRRALDTVSPSVFGCDHFVSVKTTTSRRNRIETLSIDWTALIALIRFIPSRPRSVLYTASVACRRAPPTVDSFCNNHCRARVKVGGKKTRRWVAAPHFASVGSAPVAARGRPAREPRRRAELRRRR